jgi:ElaB/YqjD/DUF883 family membrane-anchored ribosome-binding protein
MDQESNRRLEDLGQGAERLADEAAGRAQELRDRAATALEDTKQQVSASYDRALHLLERGCDRMLDYGRRNPGTAILAGVGAGVALGFALAGGGERRGRAALLPAVAAALAAVADELAARR